MALTSTEKTTLQGERTNDPQARHMYALRDEVQKSEYSTMTDIAEKENG